MPAYSVSAQTDTQIITISAKELYDGLKNKSLSFNFNQEIIVTGILRNTGSSILYNSAYLLISDHENGNIYVKAVLADKNKRNEYQNGQAVRIRGQFYVERSNVILIKGAESE